MTPAESCYLLTRKFPKEEMFGMTSQIRRASASIPANIAEGHGRENTRSFVQYLRIAQGLAGQEQIDTTMEQCQSLGKMLRALIRSLQAKEN
jgi:hypothetical protein